MRSVFLAYMAVWLVSMSAFYWMITRFTPEAPAVAPGSESPAPPAGPAYPSTTESAFGQKLRHGAYPGDFGDDRIAALDGGIRAGQAPAS